MKPKHEIKTESTPDMVCVGFMATRNPDGSFNQSVPLYQAAEDGALSETIRTHIHDIC